MSDLFVLSGPSVKPRAGGAPQQLVILLHGLGADGNDLIGLAPQWATLLPNAEFVSPHAPFPCDMAPYGRQWFSLRDWSFEAMLAGTCAAAPILDAYIDDALKSRGLDDSRLALIGFSQGTMMALHIAPRRAASCAAVLGFSGALVGPETLAAELRSKPPILLVHGDEDGIVPVEAMPASAKPLRDVGLSVETLLCRGLGHGINDEGLRRGGEFLKKALIG